MSAYPRSLQTAIEHLRAQGAHTLIAKVLPRQDNDKNQIYVSGGSSGADGDDPVEVQGRGSFAFLQAVSAESSAVIESDAPTPNGGPKRHRIRLDWVDDAGDAFSAPEAKLIEYPQYAELRMSGLKAGAVWAPPALSITHRDDFGRRVLLIGIAPDRLVATVLTHQQHGEAAIDAVLALDPWHPSPIFRLVPFVGGRPSDPYSLVETVRRYLHQEHASVELGPSDTAPVDARSQRGAGYTLEALLGIARNNSKGPDALAEIKVLSSGKVSVTTTDPNGGRRAAGGRQFVETFGWSSAKDPGKQVFTGIHRVNRMNRKSGATLTIRGWIHEKHLPDGEGEPRIVLIKDDVELGSWSWSHIESHWNLKHAFTLYVQGRPQRHDDGRWPSHYIYGPRIIVGSGTSALHFFQGVSKGWIVLEPGDRIGTDGQYKGRSQWRINGNINTNLAARLATVYTTVHVFDMDPSCTEHLPGCPCRLVARYTDGDEDLVRVHAGDPYEDAAA